VVKPIVDILDTDARAADSEGEYDTQIIAKLTPVQLAKELKTLEKQMYQCCWLHYGLVVFCVFEWFHPLPFALNW
jgi:hypothetical protein